VDAEGIAPSAGALGKGHAALAAPENSEGSDVRASDPSVSGNHHTTVLDSFDRTFSYDLNGSAPLVFGAPDSVPLFGVSVSVEACGSATP
jgi:hypothetical protein